MIYNTGLTIVLGYQVLFLISTQTMCDIAVQVSWSEAKPVFCASMRSAKAFFGLPSVVVKAVYMQIMLQCLLVWIAFIWYRLAEPRKQ